MSTIIPAIIPKSFEDLRDHIADVHTYTKIVHIDLMNGTFVPYVTWPYQEKDARSLNIILEEEDGMPFWQEVQFEFDLMITNAREQIELFMKLGASRLIFHIEAETNTESSKEDFRDFLEGMDPYVRDYMKIGIAIHTTTPISDVAPLVPYIDFVQCMGIEKVGRQGEDFDDRVFSKIKEVKEKFPDMEISVDGSVNFETIESLKEAGATRFVCGSVIFKSEHPGSAIDDLRSMIQ